MQGTPFSFLLDIKSWQRKGFQESVTERRKDEK
jgi:hypothetical protein